MLGVWDGVVYSPAGHSVTQCDITSVSVAHPVTRVSAGMLLQVILVILFAAIPRRRLRDLGRDRFAPFPRCIKSASLRFIPVAELETSGYGEFRALFDGTAKP